MKIIADRLLSACKGAGAEVWIQSFDEGLTRFANNVIHQNVIERNLEVTLRVNLAGKIGTATTNRSDPDGLTALAEAAQAAARLSPVDPEDPGISAPVEVATIHAFDEATAACSPAQRARRVNTVCKAAAQAGLNAAGAYSTAVIEWYMANSNGVRAYHPYTRSEFQTTVMGADSSGRGQGVHWQMDQVPVETLGEQALRTAIAGRGPRSLPAGEYPVILGEYAVLDIVAALNLHGVNGLALCEGRSWMIGRQGHDLVSPLISLWDDGCDPRGLPLPFDGEGQPRRKVDILRAGVVGEAVYDRATAHQAGVAPTGHALPPASRALGALACNLFMAPGQSNLETMIASTPSGLLITRFWYTRLVSARDCMMTGMTRDGVFWVEDGAVAYPVKNLRFTQSYTQALAEVSAVGQTAPLLKAQYGEIYTRVPALKIDRFRFTG